MHATNKKKMIKRRSFVGRVASTTVRGGDDDDDDE